MVRLQTPNPLIIAVPAPKLNHLGLSREPLPAESATSIPPGPCTPVLPPESLCSSTTPWVQRFAKHARNRACLRARAPSSVTVLTIAAVGCRAGGRVAAQLWGRDCRWQAHHRRRQGQRCQDR